MAVELQREARALGDPTRYRLFRYIVDAGHPVGVAELTDHVRLNHNAVRQHLAVLKDAGLIIESVENRDRPGRPRLLYQQAPESAGNWGTPGPYVWLGQLLGNAIREQEHPRETGRRAGRQRAAELTGDVPSIDAFEGEMASRGFRPVRAQRGRQIEFVLGHCPFADVAADNPDIVCQLHLGMAEGMADALGDMEVERLVAKRAHKAGCRLVVRSRSNTSTNA